MKTPPPNRPEGQRGVSRRKVVAVLKGLVALLIIGVVAAVAVPMFVDSRGQADDLATQTVVRQAETAVKAYYANPESYACGHLDQIVYKINPSLRGEVNVDANFYDADGCPGTRASRTRRTIPTGRRRSSASGDR